MLVFNFIQHLQLNVTPILGEIPDSDFAYFCTCVNGS